MINKFTLKMINFASPISLSKARQGKNPFESPYQRVKLLSQSQQQSKNSSLRQTKQYFKKYCSNKESQNMTNKLNPFTPINKYKQLKVLNFKPHSKINAQIDEEQPIKIIHNGSRRQYLQENQQNSSTSKAIDRDNDKQILQTINDQFPIQQDELKQKNNARKVQRKHKTADKIQQRGYRKSIKISDKFRMQKKSNPIVSYQSNQLKEITRQRQTSLSPSSSSGSPAQVNIYSRQNMQQMNRKLRQIRSIQQYAATYRIMTERPAQNSNLRVQTNQNNVKLKSVLKIRGQRSKTIGSMKQASHETALQKLEAGKLKKALDILHQSQAKQMGKTVIPIKAFRSTLKKKSLEDNPSFLASVIKKKMQILSKHELYQYINSLMNKAKTSSLNNQITTV